MWYYIDKLYKLCKRGKNTEPDFYQACRNGDFQIVKEIIEKDNIAVSLERGLELCTEQGFPDIAEYLIRHGVDNINDCLKRASELGRYDIVEVLVKNGGDVNIGLRYAKSQNIIRMLYRYAQNTELIN